MRFLIVSIFVLAFTSWHGARNGSDRISYFATAKVIGKIELASTKLKSRDAGGIVVWLKPADGSTPRGAGKQRKIINQTEKLLGIMRSRKWPQPGSGPSTKDDRTNHRGVH